MSPLSNDEAKRARQLANLRPGAGRAAAANARLRHGGHSAALVADVEREVLELMEALGGSAPVRDADGGLPAADVVAVERAARALKRYRALAAWCDLHGRLYETKMIGRGPDGSKVIRGAGDVKPAAELELKAERELAGALDALGMTPTSRTRLGLALAQTRRTLEDELADGREAWDRRVVDGEAREVADEGP